jgi:hypothetical protein
MKEVILIILLLFNLAFNSYFIYFAEWKLKLKCDVDKRSEFMEECINKIDLMYEPELVDATGIIKQCEETSKNLYCTYIKN